MSELLKRIFFAVPAAAFAVWITWAGGIWFYGALLILATLIQFELQRIVGQAGFKPARFFHYIIGLWILLTPVLPFAFEIGIGLFLLFAAVQVLNTKERHMQEFIATIFCAGYASFGLLFLLIIRSMGTDQVGFALTIGIFLMVWGNDVFANFGGKRFGKHMLAPSVSPSKTWEGFFFGFLGAAVGIGLLWLLIPFTLSFSWWVLVPAIIVIGIFAPLGDLAESKLKRAANVKDASSILPGHGGFFDRFDGMILAAPAFYLYLQCMQIFGYVTF
ncbi:MAG: phosphatidate cytidylyltransferase [Balneolaceae bacterium]|nr:phosphatidate cytidylyltransferase [Balneolaceae bacterium]